MLDAHLEEDRWENDFHHWKVEFCQRTAEKICDDLERRSDVVVALRDQIFDLVYDYVEQHLEDYIPEKDDE